MDKTTKTLLVGAGVTGVAFAVHKLSKVKVNPYILGGAVIVATIGNSLGGLTNYYLGKFGKFLWIKKSEKAENKQNKLKQYVTKYGSLCALLSWVPIIGDPLLVMLGFMRIKLLPVVVFMVVGKLIRYIVIALFL